MSERGDNLSPKYAPEITAPAVMLGGMPNALPTETNATPIVAEVIYELPAVNETIAVITRVNGKKTGLASFFVSEILLEEVIPIVENANFKQVEKGNNFKLIYYFPKENYKKIEDFKESLSLALSDLKNIQLNSSTDIYDNSSTFVVLHGLKSYDGAKGLSIILEQNDIFVKKSSFVISSDNYQILQMHKNLSVYLNKKL